MARVLILCFGENGKRNKYVQTTLTIVREKRRVLFTLQLGLQLWPSMYSPHLPALGNRPMETLDEPLLYFPKPHKLGKHCAFIPKLNFTKFKSKMNETYFSVSLTVEGLYICICFLTLQTTQQKLIKTGICFNLNLFLS